MNDNKFFLSLSLRFSTCSWSVLVIVWSEVLAAAAGGLHPSAVMYVWLRPQPIITAWGPHQDGYWVVRLPYQDFGHVWCHEWTRKQGTEESSVVTLLKPLSYAQTLSFILKVSDVVWQQAFEFRNVFSVSGWTKMNSKASLSLEGSSMWWWQTLKATVWKWN